MKSPPALPRAALALLAANLLAFAFPLHAQTRPSPPKFNAAGITTAAQLQQEIMDAKCPKSDKWPLSLPPDSQQKNWYIYYAVVTELTDAGQALPVPDFEKPVYCILHFVGQQDDLKTYGWTHGGVSEFLQKQLTTELAPNGYRPSDADHPPTQVLFCVRSAHNRMETARNTDNGLDVSANSDDIIDLLTRAKAVGGEKFADEFARALAGQLEWPGTSGSTQDGPLRCFAERDDTTRSLVYEIFNDCYYLTIYSFDIEALRNNQKKALWTTRISIPVRATSLEATLSLMSNSSAYYFGRKTDGPEIVRIRSIRTAAMPISMPEPKVVEYITGTTSSSGTVAPAPSGTAAGKP